MWFSRGHRCSATIFKKSFLKLSYKLVFKNTHLNSELFYCKPVQGHFYSWKPQLTLLEAGVLLGGSILPLYCKSAQKKGLQTPPNFLTYQYDLSIECEGWRRHSSLIFLILLFTKPNIEVSGWLYQTKTHFTHIVYQPFSIVSPPSFTLYEFRECFVNWASAFSLMHVV